ncbi:nicotinamide mononucleotide transporter [Candidatus Jorgensenbacteria bacterium]|nr:nicotinamide mononucleotide transporter [Candidatus Jorgensenbacteria bacterium]
MTFKDFLLVRINWLAMTLSIIGILLNANKIIWCWPVWVLSCICWLLHVIPKREWAQILLWAAFLVSNAYGWYQWLQ